MNYILEKYENHQWRYYRKFDNFKEGSDWLRVIHEKYPSDHYRLIEVFIYV